MMKKLKQEESKEKQNPDRKTDGKEEVLSSRSFFASIDYYAPSINNTYPRIKGDKTTDIAHSFFHPPGTSC